MNAPPSHRCWHLASIVCAPLAILLGVYVQPATVAAATDTPTIGWRTDSLKPTDTWNTLSLEMRVSRRHLKTTGEVIGAPSPVAAYRLERSSLSGQWKTVLTVLTVDRLPIYSLSGALLPPRAFPVGRIEDDEDGTPVRVYDVNGVRMATSATTGEAAAGLPRTTGTGWLDAFVSTTGKKSIRQQNFERLYGKPTKAGTLNRYLHKEADGSQEVLVDPKLVVAVESNAVRSNKLVGHRTFTYSPAPDSAVVRTVVHAETVVSPETGERAVVDTTFSNIRLELRR